MHFPMMTVLAMFAGSATSGDVGDFVRALWLVQLHGTASAVDPSNDQRVKGALFKALGKDGSMTRPEGWIEPEIFQKIAGSDGRISTKELKESLEAGTPRSRSRLLPKVREYADSLTTSLDMIGESHRPGGQDLAEWIARNYCPGRPLDVIVVCTGNSRRSILGSTMGNVASAYYGMPEVRFHSGGTAPTAFNARTVATLQEIGVVIEPTNKEAARGEPKTANPIYRVKWGSTREDDGPSMEATEFSKHYHDATNPQTGFAALLVCGEADVGCPLVKGATARISVPYLDPKIYDGSIYESAKYVERRDDMGRLMMSTLMQARQRIVAATGPGQPEKLP